MKALRSATFFIFVIYTMASLTTMRCRASVTTSHNIGRRQEIQNESKTKMYRPISSFPPPPPSPNRLTVNRTHDDPSSASLGYFLTQNDWRRWNNTHQKQNRFMGFTSPQRFQNYSNTTTKSKKRHIIIPCVICPSSARSLLIPNEDKCVRISLTYGKWFSL